MNRFAEWLSNPAMTEKHLNDRTRYSIIPSFSVVIHQGNQTIVLSNEELAKLHAEVESAPEQEWTFYDAQQEGFQG